MAARPRDVAPRVAIYLRISKDELGLKLGVERQLKVITQWLDDKYGKGGYTAEVYSDNNISAWVGAKRPRFEALLIDVKAGRHDLVAVWATDRLYRRIVDLEVIIDALGEDVRKGVPLVSVMGGDIDLTTSDGRLKARIMAAVAQHESDRKSERIRAKREAEREAGTATSRACYGYKRVWRGRDMGATLEVIPEQAEMLRLGAKLILDPDDPASQSAVADAWNDKGYRRKDGTPWNGNSARRALLSPTIAGLIEHKDRAGHVERHKAEWPAILSLKDWEAVKAELTDPARRHKRKRADYWLRGVIVDQNGAEMLGCRLAASVGSGDPFGRRAYRTPWKGPGKRAEGSTSIDADAVEEWVMDHVATVIDLLDWHEQPVEDPAKDPLRIIERKLEDLATEKEETDMLAGEYRARRTVLMKQRADVLAERKGNGVPLGINGNNLAKRWKASPSKGGLTVDQRRRVARWAVGQVTILPSLGGRKATSAKSLRRRVVFAPGSPLAHALRAQGR